MTRVQRIAIEVIVVLAACGTVAVLLTWPMAANITTIIPGGGAAGDNTGYIWDIWSNASYGLDLWAGGLQDHVGLPFGRTVIGGANLLLLFYTAPAALLGALLPPIAAYNILVLASLALTGASMYLLVRWLGLGIISAAWAGMAFELFPYEALRVTGHPPLAWLVFAPLFLMAAIWWLQSPTWRRASALAGATLFAWLTNPYFGAMASVAAGVTLLVGLIAVARSTGMRPALRRVGEAIGALLVIVGIPLAIIIGSTRGVAEGIVTRQRIELELYGARLEDYVFPLPGQFLWSGILGQDSSTWPLVSTGGERTNFLGWTVLILAITGLVLAWRQRRSLNRRVTMAIALAVPLSLVMVLFSLASPYTLFGVEFSTPSSVVFDFMPFLRVYARFVVMVMACVLILGAVGLWLLVRRRSITWRLSIASVAIILTAMELPTSLPLGTGVPIAPEGQVPEKIATWNWLRQNDPGAVVLETPVFPSEVLDRQFLYGQLIHGHPLANGGLNEPGAATDFGREYGNPLFRASPTAYATAGINYVVVNPWAWRQAGIAPPQPDAPPKGLAVVKTFPDGSAIWRVSAQPAPAIAFPSEGWWDPETIDGVRWRYMKDRATVTAYAPRSTRAVIRFSAQGFLPRRPYVLTVKNPDGSTRTLAVRGTRNVTLRTTLPRGKSAFHLVVGGTAPRAMSASDPRVVTLRISQWEIS